MLRFEKWEGLGNDFVVVDEHDLPSDELLRRELVRALCDRRLGVGADGVLAVTSQPEARMTVFNADGSRPEMCGNGLRCVAARLTGGRAPALVVATDAGPRRCSAERTASGSFSVTVDMGTAVVGDELALPDLFDGGPFARVSMGNPHAIVFSQPSRSTMDRVGPAVEAAVPGGINVEFVRVTNAGLDVVVWERGVGYTQACGTGACAVVVAACLQERAPFDRFVRVTLPGGDLEVSVARSSLAVTMRGPARHVFDGAWTHPLAR